MKCCCLLSARPQWGTFISSEEDHYLTCFAKWPKSTQKSRYIYEGAPASLLCFKTCLYIHLPSAVFLTEALLSPPERLCHPCRWGTRRTWHISWIKNLRAIKRRPTPSIHQPRVLLQGRVRGARSKPHAIYFYICFPSKEGRLWQNYGLVCLVFYNDVDIFHGKGPLEVRAPARVAQIEKRVLWCDRSLKHNRNDSICSSGWSVTEGRWPNYSVVYYCRALIYFSMLM